MKKFCLLTLVVMFCIINLFGNYDPSLPTITFEELEGIEYEIMEITEDYYIIEIDGEFYYVPKAF